MKAYPGHAELGADGFANGKNVAARPLDIGVLWHGGEATQARLRFENPSKTDRDALLAFLKSL